MWWAPKVKDTIKTSRTARENFALLLLDYSCCGLLLRAELSTHDRKCHCCGWVRWHRRTSVWIPGKKRRLVRMYVERGRVNMEVTERERERGQGPTLWPSGNLVGLNSNGRRVGGHVVFWRCFFLGARGCSQQKGRKTVSAAEERNKKPASSWSGGKRCENNPTHAPRWQPGLWNLTLVDQMGVGLLGPTADLWTPGFGKDSCRQHESTQLGTVWAGNSGAKIWM